MEEALVSTAVVLALALIAYLFYLGAEYRNDRSRHGL
jgi:biopolymer transport protein ExbB/TolQ